MHIIAQGTDSSPALRERSWDWLADIPPPRAFDQGPFQACVSCAIVTMIEARHWLRTGDAIRLIPGHIHKCLFGIQDHSTTVDPGVALDRIRSTGVAIGQDDAFPVAQTVCASTNLYRIDDCGWIIGRNAVLNHLVEHGPILTTMKVEDNSFRLAGDAIYEMPASGGGRRYPHAVTIVGYDVDAGWVKFVNSFGAGWGRGGVGRARFGSGGLLRDYSAAAAIIA